MRLIVLFLSLITTTCFAQPSGIVEISKHVSSERLKNDVYTLASPQMEGRMMASHGDTLASLFVENCFKQNNVKAPYNYGKSYMQAIDANKIVRQSSLQIGNNSYIYKDGWVSADDRSFSVLNTPVVFIGWGIEDSTYNSFENIDVKGKAAILIDNAPIDTTLKKRYDFWKTVSILKNKGASLLLFWNSQNDFYFNNYNRIFIPDYADSTTSIAPLPDSLLPIIAISAARLNEILLPENITVNALNDRLNKTDNPYSFQLKNRISVSIKNEIELVHAPNVIGVIEGTDKDAGCVVLSAHHDHDGKDGDTIYYGAVDNASGTSAIMEITTLMNDCVKQNLRPKRTIVFASFTGEERGELGSGYYVQHPVFTMKDTYADFNLDMIGRVDSFYSGKRADSNYAYILVIDSLNHGIRKAVYDANAKLNTLHLDTYYERPENMERRLTGSDQYPFYLKGVPFVRIDCGFNKDYHQPTDTPDKVNYQLLTEQVQLCFLTLWNIANN